MANLKVEVSLDFLNDTPEDKVSMGDNILAAIVEPVIAAKLSALPVALVLLTSGNTLLRTAIGTASSGDHSAVASRNLLEAKWNDYYRETGKYVGQVAKGDKSFILSCGFPATAEVSVPTPETVELVNFIVKPTDKSGDALVTMDGQKQAAGYLVGLFPVGTSFTQIGGTITIKKGDFICYLAVNTHHTITMQGLPSEQLLKAFALAFNLKGLGPITGTAKDIKLL